MVLTGNPQRCPSRPEQSPGGLQGEQCTARQAVARLAAPVASKALATTTSAGTGAVAGTTIDGPLGGAVGALTGIGFDLAVNKTVELVERPEFEADVHRAVAATYGEWREAVERSLQDAVGIWFGDTVQLLRSFDELQPATSDRGIEGIG